METHFMDIKEKIELPSERMQHAFPSTCTIFTLNAACAIAQKAITDDTPEISELMDMIDNNEDAPDLYFSAHNILDTIERLKLIIYTHNKYLEKYLQKQKTKNLPF